MLLPFSSRFILSLCLAILASTSVADAQAGPEVKNRASLCSPATRENLEVEFVNASSEPVTFHWMDFDCIEGGGPKLAAQQRENGITHPGHIFLARGKAGQLLTTFVASDKQRVFSVDDALIARVAAEGEPYTEGTCSPRSKGQFTVEFVNLLNEPIALQWIGFNCEVNALRLIPAHGRTQETTFPGHVFRFVDASGRQLRSVDVSRDELTYHVSDD